VYGDGSTSRDYTYIDDIVCGVRSAMKFDGSQYEVINLGNNRPVNILEMIGTLEEVLGVKARLDWQPVQPGDVPHTCADLRKAQALLGYQPNTDFREGMRRFADWICDPEVRRQGWVPEGDLPGAEASTARP